ncbi:branched-chain amino acid aminotransferase [Pseudonocardia sp. WMMC193]|uniref:branched-chain amino acid aminotransferase n=1 Tax=Pseudonocardia sp. WMMC193 TaxID=2911965 RepID=UPI001EFF9C82|nr:branched-chain amino acid aminotransferase [Pseudonocardia sp. WMMC193]MCF7548138.1 branched-chain amino acid aminotransferase [Pseudonocardia sp. WMMC193]
MSVLQFTHLPHPNPVSESRRAEILAAPGFGKFFTDHMVSIRWTRAEGWQDAKVEPYGPIALDPATMVLHYGQEIFEGLKAYTQPDGTIASFRPEANAARFRQSAVRLGMPELPDEVFLQAIDELITADRAWVPPAGGEESLYLRPFMIATEVGLGVKPADEYLFLLIASPAGAYFPGGVKPVDVWLCTDFTRAAVGGTGTAKCGGNYAASLLPQAQAAAHGCAQVAYLDAAEKKWIEEMGGMNMFFVFASGELVTPELSGSILEGVTRHSLLVLGKEIGCDVVERRISADEWITGCADGTITEVFACGTAAVITPIGNVKYQAGDEVRTVAVGNGESGAVTTRLRGILTDIQRGKGHDTHGWMTTL